MSDIFPAIALSASETARIRANEVMAQVNEWAANDIRRYRAAWNAFWDVNQTAAELQGLLDALASNPMGNSNALAYYFAEANYEYSDIINTVPTAFSDAKHEHLGALQPDGVTPYMQFKGPGWYYIIDNTGRMVVSSPCILAS